MKFQFKIQPYQTEAVDAVIQVFNGQSNHSPSSYIRDLGVWLKPQQNNDRQIQLANYNQLSEEEIDATGYKNADVELSDEQLLLNIRTLQSQNNIKLSPALVKGLGRCSLDIEMETGTGKTYVYTKTMFELNRHYGWSKFIVVVPSIAIREGVKKSLEMTEDHFMQCYGKKARFFVYDSKNLGQIDTFSSDGGISVMIINTQAFAASLNEEKNVEGRKGDSAARIIYSERDNFGSRRPIDVIAANRPIIIMDEPQKMGGEVTQKALKNFRPLFTLNYSATHAKQHNLIYVLDALDAFNQRLVKKIEVKGFEVRNLPGTSCYLYLENIVLSSKNPPRARLEFEVSLKNGTKRKMHLLSVEDNLYELSGKMAQYKGYIVSEIDPERRLVTFTNGESITVGEVQGDISERDMRRIQIRETIESHFQKEQALFEQGIKTLSLFFIDEVARYRAYGADGEELPGEYGVIFEQEYLDVLNEYLTLEKTPYQEYLRRMCSDPKLVHRGYFSIDKKTGRSIDGLPKRGGDLSEDIPAYDLILKNKERLLSFEEPTRFIFSHSALREGWDNPNVFQICTLKHSNSQTTKRQEVGRGLRLCVDQNGTRMDVETCGELIHVTNKLTVIASESYAHFVADLQSDIRKDLYDRPTKATMEYFTGKTIQVDGKSVVITEGQSRRIYRYLLKNEYVNDDDSVADTYRSAIASKTIAPLPDDLKGMEAGIHRLIQAVFDESVLKEMTEDGNASKVQGNPLNENWGTFAPMWDCINHKYAFTVKQLDSDVLIRKAIAEIDKKLFVTKLMYIRTTGEQKATMDEYALERGDSFESTSSASKTLENSAVSQIPYDLVGEIAAKTTLTRRTIVSILKGIRKDSFAAFKVNPEEFISKVSNLIKDVRAEMIVEGIEYCQLEETYDEKIFEYQKAPQSFEKAFRARKHIQDYVFTDGTAEKSVERVFAENLDIADEVCVYAKLPRTYIIPTPAGDYSPDWAIMFKKGTVKYIYFIAETKGSTNEKDLRPVERAKIECASILFNEISTGQIHYGCVKSFQQLRNEIMVALN